MMLNKYFIRPVLIGLFAWGGAGQASAQVLELEWAKSLGGPDHDESYSVTSDQNGNVYTTGHFKGTADFDPGTGVYNLTSNGERDIFISKLDAAGNFVWARSIGGSLDDESYSIDVDNSGNVYITGGFQGTVDFDPGTGSQLLTASQKDIFICKLDNNGAYVWARNMGGPGSGSLGNTYVLKSLVVDAAQNVYYSGSFNQTVDFDPGPGVHNLTAVGGFDIYMAKLNASGNYVWAKNIGGAMDDESNFITLDNNALYLTGSFRGTADFDPGTGTSNLTAIGGEDIFVAKYDTAGNYAWARNMGGGAVNKSLCIAVNKQGTGGAVYTTGYFLGATDFDPGPGTATLTSAGSVDAFVCKLDGMGNFIWAKNMGGAGSDLGTYLVANANEDIYITGYFQGTADFDPNTGVQNLVSAGGNDCFISVLNNAGQYVLAKSVGGTGSDFGSSIYTDFAGNIYTTGSYQNTADFDPGTGVFNLTSAGSGDIFVHKLGIPCNNTTSTLTVAACDSFVFENVTYDTSGTYTVPFVSVHGCDSNINLVLTITRIDNTVSSQGATLTASHTGGSYQWIRCADNSAINGANGPSYTATTNGSYAVVITEGDCSDTSDCISVSGITSITAHELPGIRIYPVPAKDKVMVSSERMLKQAVLKVCALTGQVLQAQTGLSGNLLTVDLRGYAPGIYLLELKEGNSMARLKVVKQ